MSLTTHYETTKASVKREYNKEEIMDTLMKAPLNVDINKIIETPYSISVMMPRNEYIERHIGSTISHKFNVELTCGDSMLVIKTPGA